MLTKAESSIWLTSSLPVNPLITLKLTDCRKCWTEQALTLSAWTYFFCSFYLNAANPFSFKCNAECMQSREKHMRMGRVSGREEGLLSGWKKVGLSYIRTILLEWLKQLEAGILHVHSEGKLIKSQRDRRLRTLCSTPFVRDSICTLTFHQIFFLFHSPLSELSCWGSMQGKTWQPTPAHHYRYCNGEGMAGWKGLHTPPGPTRTPSSWGTASFKEIVSLVNLPFKW